MVGGEMRLGSAGGFALTARIHRIDVSHPDLGRDFFRHIQIGFREYHHTFSITPAP